MVDEFMAIFAEGVDEVLHLEFELVLCCEKKVV